MGAARRLRAVAVGVGDRHPAALVVRQREHREVGARQLARLGGDARERLVRIGAGQQRGGDLGAGRDPALAVPGGVVQPRILHRHAGRGPEGGQHRLVVVGELAATALIGEVQVAEHLVPHPHRHSEEAAHRRMTVGEPGRCGVRGHVGEPQRPRISDQQAKQAASFRPVVDLADLLLCKAHRDELGQPLAALVAVSDDPERAVGRVHQPDRGLHDPAQRRFQVQA
jgi:hypothetical protein